MITPFLPLIPYKADAIESFKTEIDSISSGLKEIALEFVLS